MTGPALRPNRRPPALPRLRGGALVLALMLLTGLTLLALSAASDQALQARIVGNLERSGAALRTAQAALAWAEDWLFSLDGSARPAPCMEGCDGAVFLPASEWPDHPEQATPDWWQARGHPTGASPVDGAPLATANGPNPGRWIATAIEVPEPAAGELPAPDLGWYLIVARGSDAGGRQISVVESIVARPWGSPDWRDALPRPAGQPRFCQASGPRPCGRVAWRQLR